MKNFFLTFFSKEAYFDSFGLVYEVFVFLSSFSLITFRIKWLAFLANTEVELSLFSVVVHSFLLLLELYLNVVL